MIPKQPNPVLREVLADDAVERLRNDSLSALLRLAHRRRLVRRLGATGALACLIALSAWLLRPGTNNAVLSKTQFTTRITSASNGPGPVRQISDAELLALFPGQTVALIGPPGHQQFLVLGDAPVAQ